MSRRKQAKPRALKHDELDADCEETITNLQEFCPADTVPGDCDLQSSSSPMPFKMDDTNDSYDSDALGTDPATSWRSSTPDTSPAPSSCATPTSATDGGVAEGEGVQEAEAELTCTLGATEATPYQCQFCEKAFPRLSYLKKHEQTHSDQMPFRCEFCARLFKHKRSRDRHTKLHTGDRRYRCAHCEAAFSRSDHLKIHMKTHDTQKPFQCTICNRGYNTAAALTSHMQNHKKQAQGIQGERGNSPGSYRCLQCVESFKRPEELQQHVAATHKENRATPTTPPVRVTCMYCTKDSFNSMEQLQLHVQAMHSAIHNEVSAALPATPSPAVTPTTLQHSCELCTMRFSTMQGLLRHAASAHRQGSPQNGITPPPLPPTPLMCGPCSLPFPSATQFAEHYLLMHSSPSPEQVTPTDLSKKSHKRRKLSSDSETPSQPYERPGTLLCNQCGAALPDFEAFRNHLKTHLEGVQNAISSALSCSQCGAVFSDPVAHDRHSTSHFLSTTTEFGCQSCQKSFVKPDELQKHLLDLHAHHLYRCALCKEMFDSKVSIQVHFAVKHSNECKVYRCTTCVAEFRTEREFRQHVRSRHLPPPMPNGVHPLPFSMPLRCLFCRLVCSTELEMHFHLAAHARQFRCPLCPEAFHVEFLLDRHMQTHHTQPHPVINGNTPKTTPKPSPPSGGSVRNQPQDNNNTRNNCDICDRDDFLNETELAAHRKLVHHLKSNSRSNGVVSLHCAYCNENFRSRTDLENHMKTSHNTGSSGKHKCLICDEIFPSATVLAEHKLAHCKVGPGGRCAQCGALMGDERTFRAHLNQHSGSDLPSPCPVCRQTLSSELEVGIHARFHLKGVAGGPAGLHCALCLKSCDPSDAIPTGAELNHGIPTTQVCRDCYEHHGGNRGTTGAGNTWSCIQCQANFESEQDVRAHVASHLRAESNSLMCRLCRRQLTTPLQLQAHLIEHTFAGCEGRGFSCYICSAVFTGAPGLQQHMLDHGLNARPYDCSRCSLKFFFRAELDNHSFMHLEEESKTLENKIEAHEITVKDIKEEAVEIKKEEEEEDKTEEYIEVGSPVSSTTVPIKKVKLEEKENNEIQKTKEAIEP